MNAHKIVLSTSKYFEKLIESSLRHRPEYTKDGKLILRFEDFDSSIFARVLKIMYKSKVGDIGVQIDQARSMFKLACKIRAKHVQRHIIVHLLLPNLTVENCLYILNDSFNQLERDGVDDANLTLFELTKLFCARRFIKILSIYGDIVQKLKKELLLKLVTKSLHFISDESNIKDFIKLLYSKGAYNDMFELCTLTSKEFSKAVTFDSQAINIDRVLPNIGYDPVQYDLITEDTVSKRVSKEPGSKDQYQQKEDKYTPKRSPLNQSNSSYEFATPVENKVSSSNKINCKIPNLELSLEVNQSDLEKGGVTYFSE